MMSQSPQSDDAQTDDSLDASIDHIDELLSLLFDDGLSDAQFDELNEILLNDPDARRRTFEAARLHADLYAHFNKPAESPVIAPALPLPTTEMGIPTGR